MPLRGRMRSEDWAHHGQLYHIMDRSGLVIGAPPPVERNASLDLVEDTKWSPNLIRGRTSSN